MTYEEAKKLMCNRGYHELTYSQHGDEIESVTFGPIDFMDIPCYSVTLKLASEEFSFFYMVPRSMVRVELGPASSVGLEKHFKKLEASFFEKIQVLEDKFGGERLA